MKSKILREQSRALTSEALFCALGSSRSGASRFTCRMAPRRAAVTAVWGTTSLQAVAPSSHNLSLWCRRKTTSTSRPPLIRGLKLMATLIPTLVSFNISHGRLPFLFFTHAWSVSFFLFLSLALPLPLCFFQKQCELKAPFKKNFKQLQNVHFGPIQWTLFEL